MILILIELVASEDSQIIYCISANKRLQALLCKSCSLLCLKHYVVPYSLSAPEMTLATGM